MTLLACRRHVLESGIDHELMIVGPVESDNPVIAAMSAAGHPVDLVCPVADPAEHSALFNIVLLPTKREGFPEF